MTVKDGKSLIIPLDPDFYNDRALRDETVDYGEDLTPDEVRKIIGQLKQLFANPAIKVFGHNLKFDLHHLKNYGIEVANWFADTMQLSYVVDDNMQERNLDECTRRWVKPMAGYADEFNKKVDKSHMETDPHVVAIKGSLKNGFLLFFLRSVSPVLRNTQGIILYTWEL